MNKNLLVSFFIRKKAVINDECIYIRKIKNNNIYYNITEILRERKYIFLFCQKGNNGRIHESIFF